MRWSEIIRIQLSANQQKFPIPQIKAMTDGLNCKVHGLQKVRVYRHASTESDFAIQLLWETDQPQLMGSQAGLNIYQDLKSYGLVAHFVWIEDMQ